jgi:hypothetical protein
MIKPKLTVSGIDYRDNFLVLFVEIGIVKEFADMYQLTG